jgi:hypothetical protein
MKKEDSQIKTQNRATDSGPLGGKRPPQYKGTNTPPDYPFGKRLLYVYQTDNSEKSFYTNALPPPFL